MFSRLHYYLRFLLGLTRWEMYGIMGLMGLLVVWMGVTETRDERGVTRDERGVTREEYSVAFLEEVSRVSKVSRVSRVGRVRRGWRSKKEEIRSMKYEGRGKKYELSRNKNNWGRKSAISVIDINTADSLEWVAMPGIGPGFAHRILLFREKLGGFYTVSQLKEVYGLDSAWVNAHNTQLKLGRGIYRKFRINLLDWKSFRHPYISYAQAKLVLNYRAQHGAFRDFEQLKAVTLLDIKLWERMKPYLDFD